MISGQRITYLDVSARHPIGHGSQSCEVFTGQLPGVNGEDLFSSLHIRKAEADGQLEPAEEWDVHIQDG